MESVADFVREQGWKKVRISGAELECASPFDDLAGVKKPTFYINTSTNKWVCHRTGEKGSNLDQLKMKLGLTVLQEPAKASHVFIPEKDVDEWSEALRNDQGAMDYLRDSRCFTDATIAQFRLGYKVYAGHPVICIPYFDANGSCVGAKYDFFLRTAESKYTKEKGTKSQLFNLANVDTGQPLVLTEGEYDAMSAYQYGYTNVGSFPNGAQGINGWVDEISDCPKFILAVDNDAAGEQGANKFIEKAGKAKCYRVYPRLKDLGDCLKAGIPKEDVDKWFQEESAYLKVELNEIGAFKDKAIKLISNEETYRGESTGYQELDDVLGGWRDGEITVLLGEEGEGKSTFSLDFAINRIRNQHKVAIFSGEQPGEEALHKFASNYYRKFAKKEDIENFVGEVKDQIYFPNIDEWENDKVQLSINPLLDQMLFYIDNVGVDTVIIDSSEIFIEDGKNMIADLKRFMNWCRRIVRKKNIHIFILAHPHNLEKGQRRPTLKNVYGSSYMRKTCWNGIVIWRDDDNSHLVGLSVEKNRRLGDKGEVYLKFDNESKSNYYSVEVTK